MILIYILTSIFSSWGQVGSATDSAGGTGLATFHALESPYSNPAALSQIQGSYAGLQYFRTPVTSTIDLNQYGILLTDASSGAFPGALAYRYRKFDINGAADVREHELRAAAGWALGANTGIGVAGYRVRTELPTGQNINQDNMDLSVYWRPTLKFSLGAMSKGVFGSKAVGFAPSQLVPSGGLGAQYVITSNFKARADFYYDYENNPQDRLRHLIGLEYFHLDYVTLRGGLKIDDIRGESRWTLGLGWDGPRLKIGYAFQQETRRDFGDSHTVDIWLNF